MRYSKMVRNRDVLRVEEKEASHRRLNKLGPHSVPHVIERT